LPLSARPRIKACSENGEREREREKERETENSETEYGIASFHLASTPTSKPDENAEEL